MPIDLLDARSYRELVNLTCVGDVFVASNGDPQIIVKPANDLSAGWYKLELTIDPPAKISPQIFFDSGNGFNEDNSVRLEHVGGNLFTAVVRLPSPALFVRLDPSERPGQFNIHSWQIQAIKGANVAGALGVHVLRSARRDPVVFAGHLPHFIKSLRQPHFLQLQNGDAAGETTLYSAWLKHHDFDETRDGTALRNKVQGLAERPLISVVMPVYNTPAKLLEAAIASVAGQIYQNWELCIADDCSTERHVRPILKKWQRRDSRIKVVLRKENGHISMSSNTAADLAKGEWLALFDHDDLLPPHALAE